MSPSAWICSCFSTSATVESVCSYAFRRRGHDWRWAIFVRIIGKTHCGNSYLDYWKRGTFVAPLSISRSIMDFFLR